MSYVTRLKPIKINVLDYFNHSNESTIIRTGESGLEVKSVGTIDINANLLLPIILSLDKYCVRIYYYFLSKLVNNEDFIIVGNAELKTSSTNLTNRTVFEKYLRTLIATGLIINPKTHHYIVNPVYARKGRFKKLIDVDRLPYYSEEEVELMG